MFCMLQLVKMDHDPVQDDFASSSDSTNSSDDEIYDEQIVEDEGESELVLVGLPSRTRTEVRLIIAVNYS